MTSDSPQAESIAEAMVAARARRVGGLFRDLGEVLSVPQLSRDSPWLDPGDPWLAKGCLDDAAYESLAEPLLSRLRIGPMGTISRQEAIIVLRFHNLEGVPHVLEFRGEGEDWEVMETFHPLQGAWIRELAWQSGEQPRFYRVRETP
jgi:hypothetical protein